MRIECRMRMQNPASREEILLRKGKNERYDIIWGCVFKLKNFSYKEKSRNLLRWIKRLRTVEKNYVEEFLDKVQLNRINIWKINFSITLPSI